MKRMILICLAVALAMAPGCRDKAMVAPIGSVDTVYVAEAQFVIGNYYVICFQDGAGMDSCLVRLKSITACDTIAEGWSRMDLAGEGNAREYWIMATASQF